MYTSRKFRQPNFEDVRNARLTVDLTKAQCAALVGIAERNWNRYETGDGLIPRTNWYLFCKETGYPRDKVPVPAPKAAKAEAPQKKRLVRPTKITPAQHKELQRRINEGESVTKLAEEYGISRQAIYTWCEIPDRLGRFSTGSYPKPAPGKK